MNLCLLRVPGTHLFSIWAFKALRKKQILLIRSKEKNHLGSRSPAVSIIPPSVFSRLFFSKNLWTQKLASHDWIMIEISPKTPSKNPEPFNAFAYAQGTRAVETPGTLAPPPRERREPMISKIIPLLLWLSIAGYPLKYQIFIFTMFSWFDFWFDLWFIYELFVIYLWNGLFCQKNHPFGGVEYLKLPQVLGQNLLKLGAKSDAIELKWPDL